MTLTVDRLCRTKLSLSHALSQSVKISLFEELIASTIEQTKDLPRSLSETGKIGVGNNFGGVSTCTDNLLLDATKGDHEADWKSIHFENKLGRFDSRFTGKPRIINYLGPMLTCASQGTILDISRFGTAISSR